MQELNLIVFTVVTLSCAFCVVSGNTISVQVINSTKISDVKLPPPPVDRAVFYVYPANVTATQPVNKEAKKNSSFLPSKSSSLSTSISSSHSSSKSVSIPLTKSSAIPSTKSSAIPSTKTSSIPSQNSSLSELTKSSINPLPPAETEEKKICYVRVVDGKDFSIYKTKEEVKALGKVVHDEICFNDGDDTKALGSGTIASLVGG